MLMYTGFEYKEARSGFAAMDCTHFALFDPAYAG